MNTLQWSGSLPSCRVVSSDGFKVIGAETERGLAADLHDQCLSRRSARSRQQMSFGGPVSYTHLTLPTSDLV